MTINSDDLELSENMMNGEQKMGTFGEVKKLSSEENKNREGQRRKYLEEENI